MGYARHRAFALADQPRRYRRQRRRGLTSEQRQVEFDFIRAVWHQRWLDMRKLWA